MNRLQSRILSRNGLRRKIGSGDIVAVMRVAARSEIDLLFADDSANSCN
jgi:hypothetical protein